MGTSATPLSSSTRLEALAVAEFKALQPAEVKLVRSAATTMPAWAGPSTDPAAPSNNPDYSEIGNTAAGVAVWGTDREVRAEVIRWLSMDQEAKKLIDPRGLQLGGARVSGELDLRYANIPFPIAFTQCRLAAEAHLNGCTVTRLELNGSCTRTIDADGAEVKQSLYLAGAKIDGMLSLNLARIGGTLTCEEASITGAPVSIWADGIKVGGDVFLRRGSSLPFHADGSVRFVGAEIKGDLDCNGGEFVNAGDECLLVERADIHGAFQLGGGAKLEGTLNLSNATVSGFEDEAMCWPKRDRLKLDGFTYKSIAPREIRSRLDWLKLDTSDATQPYRQLAQVMQDAGDSRHAVSVLIRMERKISAREPLGFLKAIIGYGYRPGNAVWLLIFLWLLGAAMCWDGYRRGIVVPTDKEAYETFRTKHWTPGYYPALQPLAYSLENTFPLVKLGQADKWQSRSGSYLQWLTWLQIVLGWLFATLFVAGVSGIVQHD